MAESDAADTRLLGVSLAQYAGLQVAIAQGFPLEQALANERLSARKWERCRTAWAARLAREGHGSALSAALRDKQAEAVKWLGRRIAPLEEDLAAWIGFLGAYAAAPAPSALLARLGLRDDDVQRLVLSWKRRTDEDEALAKKALEIGRKMPREVPPLQIAPGKLRPFPWSPGPEAKKQPVAPIEAPGGAPESPNDADTPLRPVPIETPSFLLRGAPAPAEAAMAPRDVAPKAQSGAPRAAQEPAPGTPIGETVLGFVLPTAAAVFPFASTAEAAPPASSEGPRAPVVQSGETALVFELPKVALPFGPLAQATTAKGAPETGTLLTLDPPARRDLPFETRTAAAPADAQSDLPGPAAPPSLSPGAPAKRGTPLSTGTVLAPDGPSGPALPFHGSGGPDAIGGRVGGTDLAALVRSVQARRPEPATNEPKPRVAGDARAGSSAAVRPALTLEQHASLCAELAFSPDRTAEVLTRYGVTSETKRSLDALYAGATEQRAAWDTAYRTYYAWLSGARRSKP